ncbi:flagellar brake protein [Gallionella capsiferriformans]|jgi:c-di-GMP-binding flagellar brake protein YcgR|uniref:Type IV pilus assembly PilZ n=1 Tax=Gallionella capsiferriformans (strain ES-2) TaxID=395494 RepID=D9SCW8_GALCS|nr:flagellar brake protein [Gallionella capsiferriformans]ADL54657.1 type IV pilus assembly PilZ [Gallionella capsiferriformans ES-2]
MNDKFQPVKAADIPLGIPLAWSVYDKHGHLLLREGVMVESQRQLDGLIENGLFRERRSVHVARKTAVADPDEAKSKSPDKTEDLLSVKLVIGDTIQLQDFSSDKQRYFVKLIGFMNKKSVLVSHPRQDEKLSFIKEGHGFMVRGFAGTKTFEFSSNVISVCLTPYPYLHLAFPPQVKTTCMRKAVRIKLKLVCSVESPALGGKLPAIIEDMSISGARIQAAKSFGQVGDTVSVSLRMQVAGETQVFLVSSVIRNVHVENDSKSGESIVMHGMEFVQTLSVDLTLLQNFIYKSMLET